jgi:simple sugar transport system ATP-binding protein
VIAIRAEGLQKRYGDVVALRDGTLAIERGSVHCVVGENGAGKSTLLHLIYGQTRADAGRLWIHDREVRLETHSPSRAIEGGVGLVHQHFMLVENLSVIENVVLGREPRRGPFVDLARAEGEIAAIAGRLQLGVDPRRRIDTLSVGEQQRVEIVKALWRGAEVLLLDEPTAVLTPPEVKQLLGVLESLAAEGKTIVLVTHKLEEVAAVAARTTVMRDGRVVEEFPRGTPAAAMARAIVGREHAPEVTRREAAAPGETVLAVRDLAAGDHLHGVSLEVRAGEILGVAGVQGNGQSELVLAATGLLLARRGSVTVSGGRGHIAEDRHARAVVLDFSLEDNLLLGRQRDFAGPLGIDRARVRAYAEERLAALDVRPPAPAAAMRSLSGGNQQKVVVARELGRPGLRLLIAAEPTRGVDIGATAAIHERILAAAQAGCAVLLVSSELSELRKLADRIVVFYRGKIASEVAPDVDDDRIGRLMIGGAA